MISEDRWIDDPSWWSIAIMKKAEMETNHKSIESSTLKPRVNPSTVCTMSEFHFCFQTRGVLRCNLNLLFEITGLSAKCSCLSILDKNLLSKVIFDWCIFGLYVTVLFSSFSICLDWPVHTSPHFIEKVMSLTRGMEVYSVSKLKESNLCHDGPWCLPPNHHTVGTTALQNKTKY